MELICQANKVSECKRKNRGSSRCQRQRSQVREEVAVAGWRREKIVQQQIFFRTKAE